MSGISVTLRSVWLTSTSDLTDSVLVKVTQLVDNPDTGGTVRTYAAGRQRAISLAGTVRKISLTAQLVDATTLAWLEAHKNVVVLLRDPTGRRRYCTYFAYQATPYTFANMHDVSSWDLYETTVDESV